MHGEQRLKYDTPSTPTTEYQDVHPGVDLIKRAQQQAFAQIAVGAAADNDELMNIIHTKIKDNEFIGGRAYDLLEQLRPGITPQISERMDILIHEFSEAASDKTERQIPL